MEHRSLLVVFCFTSTKLSEWSPMERRGTGPRFITMTSVFEVPVQEQHEHSFYSSSTNIFITGSLYMVRGYRTSPGAPRPLGEVGLTPRQYTEWNVVGRARSAGDPSQQGLLPEVYRTASTGRCAHLPRPSANKPTNYQQRTNSRSCVRVVYIAGDTASSANGSRSHDCAPVMWAYGIPCPAMVSPNASKQIGGQAVVPG